MSEPVLAMLFDGPMQSWGSQSRFNRRTTLSYPTRSGIVGMIAAAMGIARKDSARLAELGPSYLPITIVAFTTCGRWTDYHTVGGGYEGKGEWQNVPRKASGGEGRTALTYREYLSDAKFGILLTGKEALLHRCDEAFHDPKWGVWLGRKCCIPTQPVSQGVFANEKDAIEHLYTRISRDENNQPRVHRRISEVADFSEGTDTLMDVPLDFAKRTFTVRRILDEPLTEEESAGL